MANVADCISYVAIDLTITPLSKNVEQNISNFIMKYEMVLTNEVSRSPKVGLTISGNLGVRKSDYQYQEI